VLVAQKIMLQVAAGDIGQLTDSGGSRPAGDRASRAITGTRRARLKYGDPVNWAAITAIGTVLAGLALPLAFIQLGALRQDRLREQVSKLGVWAEVPEATDEEPGSWTISVRIRNGSELPIRVDTVDLIIRP